MPNFSKNHIPGKHWRISSKFNQVIYRYLLSADLISCSFWDILLTSLKSQNFQRVITLRGIDEIPSQFNQIIYYLSPISLPSFRLLAQILFEISCWQDCILIFSKGHNSRKGDNSDKKKYRLAIFSMRNEYMKFQNPSMHGSYDITCIRLHSDFSKGHNSRKGENSNEKPNVCQLFFHEESIYEISNP